MPKKIQPQSCTKPPICCHWLEAHQLLMKGRKKDTFETFGKHTLKEL